LQLLRLALAYFGVILNGLRGECRLQIVETRWQPNTNAITYLWWCSVLTLRVHVHTTDAADCGISSRFVVRCNQLLLATSSEYNAQRWVSSIRIRKRAAVGLARKTDAS